MRNKGRSFKHMNKKEQIERYLKPNVYKTERKESCTAQISVRIAPSVKAKLKNIDGWHERVRQLLDEIVELESA